MRTTLVDPPRDTVWRELASANSKQARAKIVVRKASSVQMLHGADIVGLTGLGASVRGGLVGLIGLLRLKKG